MKKKSYMRPELYFESFDLAQSIAAGCDVITNAKRFEECFATGEIANSKPGLPEIARGYFILENVCSEILEMGESAFCYTDASGQNLTVLATS